MTFVFARETKKRKETSGDHSLATSTCRGIYSSTRFAGKLAIPDPSGCVPRTNPTHPTSASQHVSCILGAKAKERHIFAVSFTGSITNLYTVLYRSQILMIW